MNCFVYGALLKGMALFESLFGAPCLGLAFTQGELYELGTFPGMIQADGLVYGEVYEIDDEILSDLDQIEGYFSGHEEDSLHLRKEIHATMMKDGKGLKAWAYFFNQDISKGRQINHGADGTTYGDYRRYRAEAESEHQWYLAYGSNMNSERLRDRVGAPLESVPGYLDGYRLVFNKLGLNETVYANIEAAGLKDRCPIVAYGLSIEQLQQLDRHEGEPNHYVRIGLPFYDNKANYTHIGHVYVAQPGRLVEGRKPSAEYLAHIRAGYEKHGFDSSVL